MKEIKYGDYYFKESRSNLCDGCYFYRVINVKDEFPKHLCLSSKFPGLHFECVMAKEEQKNLRPTLKYRKNERNF